jgi:altronate dehydratase large subunit
LKDGYDVQAIISMLAGGAQVAVFTAGRGTPVGVPIAPVIKVTGNRTANEKMRENIDVYVGEMIYGESSLEEEGKRVYEQIIAVANGELTCSEKLGHREFGVWRKIMTI